MVPHTDSLSSFLWTPLLCAPPALSSFLWTPLLIPLDPSPLRPSSALLIPLDPSPHLSASRHPSASSPGLVKGLHGFFRLLQVSSSTSHSQDLGSTGPTEPVYEQVFKFYSVATPQGQS
ncbi:hypothetical protein WMY93_019441 [Mugilogobius chulae]|uniref:Uncharacterized protein n=1 Tax=Mugilogobius chulae TaxID=88201 RepID=A0AAW0NFC0_9GOBI